MKTNQKKRINGYYNHVTHSQTAYEFFREKEFAIMIIGGNFALTLVHLGFQSSSTKTGGIMDIKYVKLNKNLKVHFVFPDFNDDVAIIRERETCFGWVADPPFSIPRQLLVFIIAIENLPEAAVPYEQTTVDVYKNHIENKTLQVSDNMELSRSVREQF